MGAAERVPSELWLEVLQNIHQYDLPIHHRLYDRETLSSFSFACRTFHRVSRPLLFSRFRFTPYLVTCGGELRLPSPTATDNILKRLAFWSSPEIASFVRHCDIDPLHEFWKPKDEWHFLADSPYILLDALFGRLAHFTGLQRLNAWRVHFTQARVNVLCHLPILSELEIRFCSVPSGERIDPFPQALRVSKFSVLSDKEPEYGGDHWIPLLHRDQLHSLITDINSRLIGRAADAFPSFPNVQELTVSLELPIPSQNLTILSKFPAVRILKIRRNTDVLALGLLPPPSPIFPLLRDYGGPHQYLPMLLPFATLTHLKISRCTPQNLIATLEGVGGTDGIVSFHAQFSQLTSAAFYTIVKLLPRLTELEIRIVLGSTGHMFKRRIDLDDFKLREGEIMGGEEDYEVRTGFKPSAFFETLPAASILPPGLEHLAISWECESNDDFDQLSAYKLPNFEQLRNALITRCPALRWLCLDGQYFMFQWRIAADGVVEKKTLTKFVDVQEERDPEKFWDFF
ncbi:hypothetical protein B0H16DRAFT_1898223 [Mycena metata]|uniref:F-box domain-containing protein n=1 Tax=Mycena metata TaxID=1033252 RepID=A0AAD7HCI0_9AGAR|nr:hypothetical protein B0H16DRAFT_1898223 [Mycena metata]